MQLNFLDWLEAANPLAPAVGDDSGVLNYRELLDRAFTSASAYRSVEESRVLLPADRTVEFVVNLLAVVLANKTAVPVDPLTPERTLAEICDRIDAHQGPAEVSIISSSRQARVETTKTPQFPIILFTSGTSGVPKGVPISQGNLFHSASSISRYLRYDEFKSAGIVLPLHYSYALLSQLFCMFFVGGYSHLFNSTRNPLKIAQTCNDLGILTFCGVPSTFQAYQQIRKLKEFCFSSVRVVCSAGAAFNQDSMQQVLQLYPNAKLFNNYGMTEATPRISYIDHTDDNFLLGSCGRPIPGLEIRIFDEVTLTELGEKEWGIVGIKGPNVFSGYLDDIPATRKAFTEEGFLLSGDIGFIENGYLFVKGRADEVFNVGGEKVSPLEIEVQLNKHECVLESAIYPFDDEHRGKLAFAYLVLAEDVNKKSLVTFLKNSLPPSKIPWRFYEVGKLPLSNSGKLRRNTLNPSADMVIREIN